MVYTDDMVYTVDTVDEGGAGDHYGKTVLRAETPFEKWLSHAVVQEYFVIHCRMQVSRNIFKLTVARGCPGVFSNSLSHAGVQEYFLCDYRMQGVQEYDDTMEHYWTLLNTIEHYRTLLNTSELYWTILNTIWHYWILLNTIKHF